MYRLTGKSELMAYCRRVTTWAVVQILEKMSEKKLKFINFTKIYSITVST